jgi:hypothetical protein
VGFAKRGGRACPPSSKTTGFLVIGPLRLSYRARHGHLGDLDSAARAVAGVGPAIWLAPAIAGAGVLAALTLPARPRPHSPIGDTDMPTPLVRAAGPADHAAIRALLAIAYAPYAADIDPAVWDGYRADLLDLERHARHGQLCVAVIDGEIVGFAAFYPDAAAQNLGWPAGWASGRGLAVQRTRESGAPVFAFHTSRFMGTARALYARMGYRRAPQFDRDMNTHFGVPVGARPWQALAYLKPVCDNPAADRDAA